MCPIEIDPCCFCQQFCCSLKVKAYYKAILALSYRPSGVGIDYCCYCFVLF